MMIVFQNLLSSSCSEMVVIEDICRSYEVNHGLVGELNKMKNLHIYQALQCSSRVKCVDYKFDHNGNFFGQVTDYFLYYLQLFLPGPFHLLLPINLFLRHLIVLLPLDIDYYCCRLQSNISTTGFFSCPHTALQIT